MFIWILHLTIGREGFFITLFFILSAAPEDTFVVAVDL
jgi:hypothetical protein